jgi:hypothetical protein
MAVTQKQKGKATSPPQNTSIGLKLCIGPQQKKSVLETLDDLDVIGRGSANDRSDCDSDNDERQEDDGEREDQDEGDQENGENEDEGIDEEDDEGVFSTSKSLKCKCISKVWILHVTVLSS